MKVTLTVLTIDTNGKRILTGLFGSPGRAQEAFDRLRNEQTEQSRSVPKERTPLHANFDECDIEVDFPLQAFIDEVLKYESPVAETEDEENASDLWRWFWDWRHRLEEKLARALPPSLTESPTTLWNRPEKKSPRRRRPKR